MSPHTSASRGALAALLQLAHSGELAAAHAYRGHAASVADASEREAIAKIEREEWHHRQLVRGMLGELGQHPQRWREWRALAVGKILGCSCHVSGWFAPMYGAGKLELRNIREYENAARLARAAGLEHLVDCLLTMAEVEWEHELYFREKVSGHALSRVVRVWLAPPPKAAIRATFEQETRPAAGLALVQPTLRPVPTP